MADLKYKVAIDTSDAARSLSSLQSSIAGFGVAVASAFTFREIANVSSRFQDLRTSLGLLYKDAQLGADAFDDIKKFAMESVFSVEDLTNTVIKLKAAGLEPTVAMLKLFADTSSVAADSVGALQAITDLYARTTAGGLGLEDLNRLADRGIPVFTILQDRLGLARLEVSKLGQTAEGAAKILSALEQGLSETFGGASEARANNVSQAVSNLGDAFDNTADAIGQAGLNQGLASFYRSLGQLLEVLTPTARLIGQVLGGALSILANNIKLVTAAIIVWLTTMAVSRIVAITTAVINLAKGFSVLNAMVGKNPLVKIIGISLGAAAAIGLLARQTDDLTNSLDNVDGAGNGFKTLKDGTLGATDSVQALSAEFVKTRATIQLYLNDLTSGYNQANYAIENSLRLQQEVLGLSEKEAAIRTAMSQAQVSFLAKRDELTRKIAEIEATGTAEEKANLEQLQLSYKALTVGYEFHIKAVEQLTAAVADETRTRQAHLFTIQEEIRNNEELARIQDEMAKLTMSEIEAKYYDIEAAANASARAAIAAEEARRNEKMPIEEQKKYYDIALSKTAQLKKAQGELYNESRRFSTGWTKAMKDYIENATNAARRAENAFRTATAGMEEAIVNFARTGKFEWRNFVQMMLEELLRSQIQQVFAQMMGNMQGSMRTSNQVPSGGGGSLIGNIGSSIISSIGGSLIGNIGKSIGKFFGGFFADGGTLGAGKFGIVGERGPELISGPATITPLGMGGSTYVTYNINAVDALSFKQLVAQDPGFMHAVVMQGAKSAPMTRR